MNINDCASNPCLNGATCTDGIASYTCSCDDVLLVLLVIHCETNIDDCASDPCLNGGTCSDGIADYGSDCT